MKLATCGSNGTFEAGTGLESRPNLTPVSANLFPDNVEEALARYHFTLARLADGTVVGVGGQANGELGDGTRQRKDQPTSPTGLSGVKALDGGGAHCIALHDDGTVSTWGLVIGDGRELGESHGSPVPVHLTLTDVIAVCGGGADQFAITAEGRLLGWGNNRFGQVGDGTKVDKLFPTPIALDEVVAVAAGGSSMITGHALALLSSGKVAAWGANAKGQSGAPGGADVLTPRIVDGIENAIAVIAGFSSSFAILSDGTLLGWGVLPDSTATATPKPLLAGVSFAAAGVRQVLAVVGGQVLGAGKNDHGELGDGTVEDKPDFAEAVGIEDVRSLSIGGADNVQHTAFVHGSDLAAETPVVVEPSVGALTLAWTWPPVVKPWIVKYRLVTAPVSDWVHWGQVPPAARTVTIDGLESGKRYDVYLQTADMGPTIVRGTPL